MNGYFAIQLDIQSQNVVSKNATMPVMVSDHITLAYKPVKKVYDKYSNYYFAARNGKRSLKLK